MTLETLQFIWYLLFFVLITGYAILDGFDLGVGVVHLFTSDRRQRKLFLGSIAPYWDGNEVWLLTGGGALFAAFPPVYATLFSSFYLPFMLLLLALIFRAISIEFRFKMTGEFWSGFWDRAFGLASLGPALLLGVALANVLRGLPLDENGLFTGTFPGLLNPYALLGGALSLAAFTLHGAIYLKMRFGEQAPWLNRWISTNWIIFVLFYAAMTITTLFNCKPLLEGLLRNPLFWLFFIATIAAILITATASRGKGSLGQFIASSSLLLGILGMCAVALFPNLIPSRTNPDYNLTIFNSSSTQKTLQVMLTIALMGVPVVLIYTAFIYRVFKGKVDWADEGY